MIFTPPVLQARWRNKERQETMENFLMCWEFIEREQSRKLHTMMTTLGKILNIIPTDWTMAFAEMVVTTDKTNAEIGQIIEKVKLDKTKNQPKLEPFNADISDWSTSRIGWVIEGWRPHFIYELSSIGFRVAIWKNTEKNYRISLVVSESCLSKYSALLSNVENIDKENQMKKVSDEPDETVQPQKKEKNTKSWWFVSFIGKKECAPDLNFQGAYALELMGKEFHFLNVEGEIKIFFNLQTVMIQNFQPISEKSFESYLEKSKEEMKVLIRI